MIPLIVAVLCASLLGSLHCAGMCGAFVAFAVTGGRPTPGLRWRLHAAYNLGRLAVYSAMGAAAGAVGAAIDLSASLVGLQRAAAVLAGAMMACVGLITLARLIGVRVPQARVPLFMQRLAMAGHRTAAERSPVLRAAITGLLTTLLPCGWLYAFVITAAGTAGVLSGALTMAVFWVGTLPVLLSLGIAAQRLSGPLGRRLPFVTALTVVAVGLFTVVHRAELSSLTGRMLTSPAAVTGSAEDRVRSLNSEEMPCCHGDD